jgi:hypothetical protein
MVNVQRQNDDPLYSVRERPSTWVMCLPIRLTLGFPPDGQAAQNLCAEADGVPAAGDRHTAV